jgi:hypothetical protein
MKRKNLALVAIGVMAMLALMFFRPAGQEEESPFRPRRQEAESPLEPPARLPDDPEQALPVGFERVDDAPMVRTTPEAQDSGHRLRGRVIDGASGTAIPGLRIEVEGTSLGAVSDAEGRFFLDLAGKEPVTLRVRPTPGWEVSPGGYPVTAEILERGDEVVVWALRVPMGAWSFLLVDQATDEPVPHFAISAEVEGERAAELLSDEEGVVVVGEHLGGRQLSVRCRDHPLLHMQWDSAPPLSVLPPMEGAPPPRLGIRVGPTYRLNVEGVGRYELENLRAVLFSHEHRRPSDEHGSYAAPVRTEGGGQPWVRFGPVEGAPGPGPPWLLEVSKAPVLSGEVAVQQVRGVHPGVLDVRLEGVGAIRGLAWNEDSDAPIVGAFVALNAAGGKPGTAPDRFVRTPEDGTFRFPMLRSGSYSIALSGAGYPYESVMLEVLPGEEVEHEFRLSRAVPVGQVSGTLTSATGQFSMSVRLILTPSEGGVSFVHDATTWKERDESMVAPFVFEEVPYGEYRLSLIPRGGCIWEPRAMDVHCPAEGLAFLCRDDIESIDFHIRAFDASTQEELSQMWVFVESRVDGDLFGSSSLGPVPSGFPLEKVLPGRTTLDWVVGAPGFAPIRGDASSLVEATRHGRPTLEAEVHLERGWGILLETLESGPDGPGPPVAGAKVYADGKLLGRTGTDGRLLLRRPRAPDRLEVRSTSLSVSSAEAFGDEGRLLPKFMIRARVWMR